MSLSLEQLGYRPFFAAQLELLGKPELAPARVTAESRGLYQLAGCGAATGELSGRLRHALGPGQMPTTGDWVAVTEAQGLATIHHVLDRQSVLGRRAAGGAGGPQVVAANVDVFFIVTSANRDLNPRRLERYLAAVWDSGARPVIVLNKTDLVADLAPWIEPIEEVALAVPVVAVSAQSGAGLDQLRGHLEPGLTFGFVGSSGVGKSTLINRLLGREAYATDRLRADGKGRHTTTRRELVVLGEGGVLIDTPGMRELGILVDPDGLDAAFAEIAEIAPRCRFNDCQHEAEPDCAVRAAVEAGELAEERLDSYRKLQREIASAEARKDPVAGANTKRRWKSIHKQLRTLIKVDPKQRR